MLGFLGLIAVIITDWASITNTNLRVVIAASCALLSAQLVRIVRDRMQIKAQAELDRILRTGPAVGEALRAAHPLPENFPPAARKWPRP